MIADDVSQVIARRFKTELLKAAVIHDGPRPGRDYCAVTVSELPEPLL